MKNSPFKIDLFSLLFQVSNVGLRVSIYLRELAAISDFQIKNLERQFCLDVELDICN